jgi:hypothetical protein
MNTQQEIVQRGRHLMDVVRMMFAFGVCSFVGIAIAQSSPALPNALSGRWTYLGTNTVLTDTISIVFEGNGVPGPISGKITAGGVTCGTKDEPFSGTWDGTVLRFEVTVRANVNTTRRDGDCSALAKYVLTRKPGQSAFEGEVSRAGVTSRVQLAP